MTKRTIELDVPKKMTILDAASTKKHRRSLFLSRREFVHHVLQKLQLGSATMIQNNILTDSEIKEGLVLTCQAVPQTNEITVDYDDV